MASGKISIDTQTNGPYVRFVGYDPYNSVAAIGHELQTKGYAVTVDKSQSVEDRRLRRSPKVVLWYLETHDANPG